MEVAWPLRHHADAVLRRYQDAYRVANTMVAIDNGIKVAGGVLAVLLFLAFLLAGGALSTQSGGAGLASLVVGGVVAGAAGLLFWLSKTSPHPVSPN